jgi:hypothetical protein
MIRTLRIAALLVGASAALSAPSLAQDSWVGVGIGTAQARFDGPATVDFTNRRGWSVGVFADVLTPLRPIQIRVEGRWSRRGGDETGGGGAESDLLSVPLALGPRFRAGRAALFPFLGLEVAYPLATRRSQDIEAGFGTPNSAEFGGFVGGAIDVDGPAGLRIGVEARLFRGFAGSFSGDAGQLDLRATEFTLRVARPLR